MKTVACLMLGALAGCASVENGVSEGPIDAAVRHDMAARFATSDFATPRDLSFAGGDLAGQGDDAGQFDSPDMADPIAGCHPLVNEVQTGTLQGATEEFVELYNPCGDLTTSGWRLVYSSQSDSKDLVIFTLPNVFAGGGYLVACGKLVNGGFCSGVLAGSLADKGGAVGLVDGNGAYVDTMAYQTLLAPNHLTRGSPAPASPVAGSPGASLSRLPNGSDTGNNGTDFRARQPSTPGSANR